jgi:hypothetical protein
MIKSSVSTEASNRSRQLEASRMGRSIDQDVHAAFVEFKAKGIVIHIFQYRTILYTLPVTKRMGRVMGN